MATDTQNFTSQKSDLENPKKSLTLNTQNISDLTDKSPKLDLESHNTAVESDGNRGSYDINKEADETKDSTTTSVVSPTGNSGSANDIEKKVRRAERFGVPVQLSEQEKRNSRAERFGIGGGSEASKASEELKRKARAERFGISVPADEEAKKKARLAKFNSETKTDPLEEEKRKARALRFAKPSSDAVLHINGKGDVGSDTAIAGNSVGGA